MHTREGVLEAASQHSKRAEHQGVRSVSEVSHRPPFYWQPAKWIHPLLPAINLNKAKSLALVIHG